MTPPNDDEDDQGAADEAPRRAVAYVAPPDRLITTPFVVVTLAAFAFFVYIGALIPLVPLYIEGPIGSGEFGVGVNAAVFAIAAIVARPALGRLADARGRRFVIVGGALVASVGALGISQSGDLTWVLLFRVLTGIGEAGVFVGSATLIADLSPADRRAEGASYFSVAIFSGLGFGPVFGEWFLDDTFFERTFVAAAVFALLAALIGSFAPARVVSPDAGTGSGQPAPTDRSGWRRHVHPSALLPGAVMALGVGSLTTFFLFVPDYSRTVGLGSSGGLFLLYAAASLIVRIFFAKLPDRLGPRRMVTIALTNFMVGLAIVTLFAQVWALWVAALFVGLGAAFNYPSLMALAVNRVPDRERAAVISSFTMFFEIGGAVSGLAVGALGQLVGKRPAFLAGVVFPAIGLVVLRRWAAPAVAPESDAGEPVLSVAAGD
ncbi:MAG: MFS transporter [Actinomycetota bacterium]